MKQVRIPIVARIGTLIALLIHCSLQSNNQLHLPKDLNNVLPVAIIGSGPAGLSAALYTARAKIPTYVFTGPAPRGTLNQVQSIENWPGKRKMSGSTAMEELEAQIRKFQTHMLYKTIKKVNFKKWPFELEANDGTTFNALAVIIATGGATKKLPIPGADKYWGKGVGSCTICDAPFNKGQNVIVVGGGDTAAQRALQIAAYAKNVTMIVKNDKLTACPTYQEYLSKAPNISIKPSTAIEKIDGNNKTVTGATIKDLKTNQTTNLPVKAVYFSAGYKPVSDLFASYIDTNKKGYIIVEGRTQKTSIPGVFAAGNVVDPLYRKTAVAIGQGVCAGMDAISFLESLGFTSQQLAKLSSQFYTPTDNAYGSLPTITTNSQLEQVILTAEVPVVIVFFSPQCPYCVHLMPTTESLAHTLKTKARFYKIDAGNQPELIEKYGIDAIPSIIIFNNGVEAKRILNIQDKADLTKRLTEGVAFNNTAHQPTPKDAHQSHPTPSKSRSQSPEPPTQ